MEHRITAAEERPGELDLPRLLEEYGDGLLRMCTLYLGDYALAEDAVQDTFLRAMNAWPRFRGACSEKTWLTSIAANVCRSYLRSPWRRRRAEVDPDELTGIPEPALPDDTLVRAVRSLPEKYRAVVVLYYYRELKAREVAQILHIPVSTVTVRLSRARSLLKEALKGWYYDEEG